MKTQRILGILWLAVGSYIGISALWHYWFLWQAIFSGSLSQSGGIGPSLLFFAAMCGPLYLFGAVASIFLFRGARWARISVGVIALYTVVYLLAWIMMMQRFPHSDGVLGVFAIVSLVLLLLPRHEAVA